MEFSDRETYEADVARTFAMFCDDAATVERAEAVGHRDAKVIESGEDGGDYVIKSSRVVDVDLPGFAKKVLKPTNTMIQTDRWGPETDGARAGSFDIDVKGAPVKVHGTMALTPTEGGCIHEITGNLEVKVPLVGGRIAKWAAGDTRETLRGELEFNQRRLAGS